MSRGPPTTYVWMTVDSDDELKELIELWQARGTSVHALFDELREPMRQAARGGLRQLLAAAPSEHDVDDAVFTAFKELLRVGPETRTSLVGYAKAVARRRGQDRARVIIRERERVEKNAWQIAPLKVTADEERREAELEATYEMVRDCKESLTAEQREVVEATIERQEALSDWASSRGTSYEAGRRMRGRALKSLGRCIEAKRDAEREDRVDD